MTTRLPRKLKKDLSKWFAGGRPTWRLRTWSRRATYLVKLADGKAYKWTVTERLHDPQRNPQHRPVNPA